MSELSLDLDRAVLALSDALDLIGVDDVGHGHRVGLMAATVAQYMEWDKGDRHQLFHAGLLHDCGVSSTREHTRLVDDMDWEGEQLHCARGAAYVSAVPVLAGLAPIIADHHTHWVELRSRGLDPRISRAANLIYLCDRADTLRAGGIAPGRPLVDALALYNGSHWSPDLFAGFKDMALREAFWFAQDEPGLRENTAEIAAEGPRVTVDAPGVRAMAAMFGRIIDAKSPWTECHSLGVARLALWLGRRFGLGQDDLDRIEIAALLHDLGKLRVPDELLDKAGPLSPEERRRMARHAYDTWVVLRRLFGADGPIPLWAACHHEAVSGHGYPFHREGEALPLPARIIAVADVVQALAQRRPYREGLAADEIVTLLGGMVFGGRLDREVVAVVAADPAAAWGEAMGMES